VQNVAAAWQLRREIDYRRALRPMLIRFAALPLGVWLLSLIGSGQKDIASQMVGVVVLAIVAVQLALRIEPRERVHAGWEWLAFGMGGLLLGLCGIGGPPMVLWVMAHNWSMNRARAFLFFIFATGIPLQALLLWLAFGNPIFEAMLLGLAALPAVAAGLYVGLWIARIAPDRALRNLSWAVLVLIAVSSIVMPYVT
jgi:uncharacterized membrane protein YfcA